ncbi:MAG: hypothetical protein IPP36_07940 [Nitrosomonadales bacterium]|nr:hypothetical protein [Nitrosomonadales bacterium]
MALEKTFGELLVFEGKTGKEIGLEFQRLLKEIERIRPKKTMIDNRIKVVTELIKAAQSYPDDLSAIRADRSAQFERSLKSLNRQSFWKN